RRRAARAHHARSGGSAHGAGPARRGPRLRAADHLRPAQRGPRRRPHQRRRRAARGRGGLHRRRAPPPPPLRPGHGQAPGDLRVSRTRTREALLAFVFLLPALVILGVFVFYPLGRTIWLGLYRGGGFSGSKTYVGWHQYWD